MKNLLFVILLLRSFHLSAQQAVDINQAMQISADYTSQTDVNISWLPKEDATGYTIAYRTDKNVPYTVHQEVLDSSTTSFLLTGLNPQRETTEVRVTKLGGTASTGYMLTGNEYLVPEHGKSVLLVVEEGLHGEIVLELDNYVSVLQHELWQVHVLTVGIADEVTEVKQLISERYSSDPFDHMILLGHVPVPYSGNNAIDGHTSGNNHVGAWVCDAYYGDLDGNWTDVSVNNEEATRDANKNIPGDGKFDQNFIPSTMEIAVGRIDFSDLPAFANSEVELTKKYLAKNIAYRTGEVAATRRGLVDNNFGLGEGFGQGAIKSFSGFFPVDSIHYLNYSTLTSKDYLWSFGAGGGSYKSASGIINTNQLATDSIQSVFTTLFGSYFGDWDNSDNLLRASIASGSTLVNAWSGRPIWHFHFLAMGSTFGEVVTMVQNNNGSYASQFGNRLTHISFIGDPTLKMYYSRPASEVEVTLGDTEFTLIWQPSPDLVDGYNIYERTEDGSYFLVNESLISGNEYTVTCPTGGDSVVYVVRPVVLETSPSGSYYNEGAGVSIWFSFPTATVAAGFSSNDDGSTEATFINESTGATEYFWDFGDDTFSTASDPMHTYAEAGDYIVTLIASSACKSDTFQLTYSVTPSSNKNIQAGYKIYPNPANVEVSIDGLTTTVSYEIFDPIGRKVQQGNVSQGQNTVDLSHLAEGLFYIKFSNASTYVIAKY